MDDDFKERVLAVSEEMYNALHDSDESITLLSTPIATDVVMDLNMNYTAIQKQVEATLNSFDPFEILERDGICIAEIPLSLTIVIRPKTEE